MSNITPQILRYQSANKWHHVCIVVTLGAILKLVVARDVAVNGDTGLYLYDAQQILMGRIQFVDYPSRSPVFEHLLALAISIGNSPLESARAMMFVISILLGVAVYIFTRQLHSHRAGLAGMAISYLTPFTLVWGAWVKTEQAAALTTLAAFIVAIHVIDRERIPWWSVGVVGALFGVSYLIRRVAIVHIGAFALFVLWYRYRNDHRIETTLDASIGVFLVALGTLFIAYFTLVRGDLELTRAVAEIHSLALFQSGGQGSLGWIYLGDPVAVTAESRTSILARICQKCGANTLLVFADTAMVTLPALAALAVLARAGLRRTDAMVTDYGVPAIVSIAIVWRLLRGGMDPIGIVSLAVVLAVALVVWFSQPIETDTWTEKLALPVFVLVALAAGYLYRDRILYTTYFQDFFPFVAVLGGIAVAAWLRRNRSMAIRGVFVVVLILAAVTATAHADPYQPQTDDLESHWFTTGLVDAYGDDMDARLPGPDRVFTAQPLYVIHSDDARPLADLSRRYYLFRGWPESERANELEGDLVAGLEAGNAPYAINDTNVQEIARESAPIRETLDEYYCPVDAPLYERTGAQLLAHENTGECA